jgi:hypothetical protein
MMGSMNVPVLNTDTVFGPGVVITQNNGYGWKQPCVGVPYGLAQENLLLRIVGITDTRP